ncbi:hypothetical protein [Streptomyces apocyni]|uniref:hypothetical protein n=1 Tax=Streptomyces apocyni TaxID=2654677 RepID=UPI0012E99CC4|nr:hypothetical protein [Streptomyces apocyni]
MVVAKWSRTASVCFSMTSMMASTTFRSASSAISRIRDHSKKLRAGSLVVGRTRMVAS